jgi:glucan phosphoethanolaminetransferase (alkaline phosphatase superfamily)
MKRDALGSPIPLGPSVIQESVMQSLPLRVVVPFVVLCLPYVGLATWLERVKGSQSLAAFVASVALLMWVLAFATQTWRRFFLLQMPILLLSAAFAGYTLSFDNPPGQLIAYVLATSSWEEVRGFFGIWQGERLLLAAAILTSIYLLLAFRSPPRPISSGRNTYLRWGIMGAVVLLSAYAAQNSAAFIDGIAANPVFGTAMFVAGPLRHANATVNGTAIQKVPYGASRVGHEEVHILIIGESARRDSWSVYGYERKTTPNLEKLRGEAIFFQNAVADANLTIAAVPILLTGMSPGHFDMNLVRGNLVDLAEEAGYATAWLMNQDPHISLLIGIHADRMVYPPAISTLVAGHLPLDEALLPDFRREIARSGKARFIGLHVIGSHWQYDSRYPAAFEHFGSGKGLTYLSALSGKPDQQVVNAYDNSVAYTDWFLGQVIEQARKLTVPATVTYFADHGEDLFMLDGRSGHGAATYSKHQFDIPAFVWVNSAYREAHADKVQAMTQNSAKEIRSHNVFYSVADLMGIEWPGASPAQSFASAQFVPDLSPQVIAGGALVSRVD